MNSLSFQLVQKAPVTSDVFREIIQWDAKNVVGDPQRAFLPEMRTDISVVAGGRKVIIDTKYYRETLTEHYGSTKIHSENLYQLFDILGKRASKWGVS